MFVNIQLYSTLKKYAPNSSGHFEMELPEKLMVRDLLEKIGLPSELHIVYFINGCHAKYDTFLENGDTLMVHLVFAGG